MKPFLLIIVFVGLLAGNAATQNLVVGGDFENPVVPAGSEYLVGVSPVGWAGTGDLAVQGYAKSVPSGNGQQWFDLNPNTDAGSGISQSISLSTGTPYSLSFLFNGGGGGTTTQIAYSLQTASEILLSGSVSTAHMSVYDGTPWRVVSVGFVPSVDGVGTLSFTPNGVYSGGFIDAVSLTVVPEPCTAGFLSLGALLGAFALLARRRDRPNQALE